MAQRAQPAWKGHPSGSSPASIAPSRPARRDKPWLALVTTDRSVTWQGFDARLGHTALSLLELGYKASAVVEELARTDPFAEYRQLGVIDADGFAAGRTGKLNRDWAGHRVGDGYIVLGNVLTGEHVLDARETSGY